MSEDSGQSAPCPPEEGGSPCASPTPSLTPSLPAPTTPVIPTAPDTPNSEHSIPGSSASARSEVGEPPRPRLSASDLESISLPDLIQHWKDLDVYTEWLDNQAANQEVEIGTLREYVDRTKQQHLEACARERAVLRRLATKEQEIQELMAQITDLKTSATPSAGSLRSALLDPAVNLLLQKLRTELATARAQLEETQNELSAWKFTPDSNTGKRLMAKCRQLYQENEELGKLVASGRMAKLEGELALQKSFSWEVKKSQSEMDEFLQELDEDVEGMQSTIYYLQQELRKSRETISLLEREINKYKNGKNEENLEGAGANEGEEEIGEEAKDEEEHAAGHEDNLEGEDAEETKEEWKGDEEGSDESEEEEDSWEDGTEGDEGEEEWEEWEEDDDELELNDYAPEDSTRDWRRDHKDPPDVDSTQDYNLADEENSPRNDNVSMKRTKSPEDIGDKVETPVRKKLKAFFPGSENGQEFTIVEGLNDRSNFSRHENV